MISDFPRRRLPRYPGSGRIHVSRVVDPPRDLFSRLPVPLTLGEQQVFDFFDSRLDPSWEIYVQPHLNGLRPDLALLNPACGVALFEVKSWDLSKMQYFVRDGVLWGRQGGTPFRLEDPVAKLSLYEDEVHGLYLPRLEGRNAKAVITTGLIFTHVLGGPCSLAPRSLALRLHAPVPPLLPHLRFR